MRGVPEQFLHRREVAVDALPREFEATTLGRAPGFEPGQERLRRVSLEAQSLFEWELDELLEWSVVGRCCSLSGRFRGWLTHGLLS